jgi:hypothetical protein
MSSDHVLSFDVSLYCLTAVSLRFSLYCLERKTKDFPCSIGRTENVIIKVLAVYVGFSFVIMEILYLAVVIHISTLSYTSQRC